MAYTPYQLSGSQTNLLELLQESDLKKQKSQSDTSNKMFDMKKEYDDKLIDLQKKAENRKDKNKGLWDGLKKIATFTNPMVSAILGGISGVGGAVDAKKGAKMLLDRDMKAKYGNTFLGGAVKDYWEQAKDSQVSNTDIFGSTVGSTLEKFAQSKMLGGDEDGGVIKKMSEAKKTRDKLNKVFAERNPGKDYSGKKAIGIGNEEDSWKSIQDFLNKKDKNKLDADGNLLEGQTIGDVDYSKINPSNIKDEVLLSKNPALKQLMSALSFEGADFDEKSKKAMMIPTMLQLLLGIGE